MTKIENCYSKNLKNKPTRTCFSLRAFNYFLFFLILVCGFAYLMGVSDLTVKSFALKELKSEQAALMEQKLSYEQEIDALQSYYVLSNRAQLLDMVAINDIEYIKAPESSVAKK